MFVRSLLGVLNLSLKFVNKYKSLFKSSIESESESELFESDEDNFLNILPLLGTLAAFSLVVIQLDF